MYGEKFVVLPVRGILQNSSQTSNRNVRIVASPQRSTPCIASSCHPSYCSARCSCGRVWKSWAPACGALIARYSSRRHAHSLQPGPGGDTEGAMLALHVSQEQFARYAGMYESSTMGFTPQLSM
jgi:hypothetical protein